MRNLLLVCTLLVSCLVSGVGRAEERPMVRELFVPIGDMEAILEGHPERVLLSRNEYDALRKSAEKRPDTTAPISHVLTSADYRASVIEQRIELIGHISIDLLEDGLHVVPLDLAGAALRRAELDGENAPIGKSKDGRHQLFLEGKGSHRLTLHMVAPLRTTAAQQEFHLRVPVPASTALELTVPGDVEITSGAKVIARTLRQQAGETHFVLLARPGDMHLVMTLNSHTKRQDRAVVARSVMVAEVTEAYEKIHAIVAMEVLHRGVDRFRFAVPQGFEVTVVTSPEVVRWAVTDTQDGRTLEVHLREETTGMVVLNLSAVCVQSDLDAWSLSSFTPLDVVSHVAVVGLLVDQRLRMESIDAQGLISIETAALDRAIPASLSETDALTPVAAWYAPGVEFSVSGRFAKPPAEMDVTTNILLTLNDRSQKARGGFVITPKVEDVFAIDLETPAEWSLTEVTADGGVPLPFHRIVDTNGTTRVHIQFPQGIRVGQNYRVFFAATNTPQGWLTAWTRRTVDFPAFRVLGATRDIGAIAIDAQDEIQVRPDTLDQLMPLDESEKEQYLSDIATDLAYRYAAVPYQGRLIAERVEPRLTARTYSFLHIEPDVLTAHYEIEFNIEEARASSLSLLLPEETPTTVSIQGLDGLVLKETIHEPTGAMRRWKVFPADPKRGTVRLSLDFVQPLDMENKQQMSLPLIQADGVTWQSGLVAVEGSEELQIDLTPGDETRSVDVGELTRADYTPGRRLLGTFGFAGTGGDVSVHVARHPEYPVYPVIVQQAELRSRLSESGNADTVAIFRLRTKAPYLEVALPDEAELWAATLDGQPIKPQRDAKRLLMSMPPEAGMRVRLLELFFSQKTDPVSVSGKVSMNAPRLYLRAAVESEAVEVPTADLVWNIILPSGYELVSTDGTVATDQSRPRPALSDLGKAVLGMSIWRPSVVGRRTSARMVAPYYLSDDVMFEGAESMEDEYAAYGEEEEYEMDAFMESNLSELSPTDGLVQDPHAGQPTADMPARPAAQPATSYALPGAAGEGGAGAAVAWDAAGIVVPQQYGGFDPQGLASTAVPAQTPDEQWRMEGYRSLRIGLEEGAEETGEVTLHSLGVARRRVADQPDVSLCLANTSRFDVLGWVASLVVLLIGAMITGRRVRSKVRFVLLVILFGTLLPLIPGLELLARPANFAVYAAAVLVPYYLAVGFFRWGAGLMAMLTRSRHVTAAACLLLAAVFTTSTGLGAEPPTLESTIRSAMSFPFLPPPEPVKIPDDAVLLPYDPSSPQGVRQANQLLVPYAKYVELWNRANPDQRLQAKVLPADYALAGSKFTARLEEGQFLVVQGELAIDVFAEGPVAVPFRLSGGVLAEAKLDGRLAKLNIVHPSSDPYARPQGPSQQSQIRQRRAPESPAADLLALNVLGQGRHEFTYSVRLRIERQGGWRVVDGVVPFAPASDVTLTVPLRDTELRVGHATDPRVVETKRRNEQIETSLGPNGLLNLSWRPHVAQTEIDAGMTVESSGLVDIQEDGVHVLWTLDFQFRRGRHDVFQITIPDNYLVERVVGTNVRGWRSELSEGKQQIEVELLNTAENNERLSLHLVRGGAVGSDALGELDVPTIGVVNASLHSGQITIRRSPLLDVRITEKAGLSRTDMTSDSQETAEGPSGAEQSPLGLRPFQAYRFVSAPYKLRVAVVPVAGRVTSTAQHLLKIAEYERTLESRIVLRSEQRPLYRVEMLLPDDFRLQSVSAPGSFEWAVTERAERQCLSIYLAAGKMGEIPILLAGKLGAGRTTDQVPVPNIEVLDVVRQLGDLAVQADPMYDVDATNLSGCASVLLHHVHAWLNPDQQSATRLALRCTSAAYGGTLALAIREPDVTCDTITNVRVTDRAVEETILIDFTITKAGVREVSFLLPPTMIDARISAPLLRQKTVEPTGDEPDSPLRIHLELQDDVMDEFRVLIKNDRLLIPDNSYAVPVPIVETGTVQRRFVTLESAGGRDEVIVDKDQITGLASLGRQQKDWAHLVGILGDRITQAYVASGQSVDAQLLFKTRQRALLQTLGARIGLAETTLIMDESGTYRAEQIFWVDNRSKQWLDIELPIGAALWTAQLWTTQQWSLRASGEGGSGESIKPTHVPGSTGIRKVRIPLIMTQTGDLDFVVRIQYGGPGKPLGRLKTTSFPLVRVLDMPVELSQVRLHLPESHRYKFDGTMRLVREEGDLLANKLAYVTKEAEQLRKTILFGNVYEQTRASNNLKQLGLAIHPLQGVEEDQPNRLLARERERQREVFQKGEAESVKMQQSFGQMGATSNAGMMLERFNYQSNSRARNAVTQLGKNFDDFDSESLQRGKEVTNFNPHWLDQSNLSNEIAGESISSKRKSSSPTVGEKAGQLRWSTDAKGLDKQEVQLQQEVFRSLAEAEGKLGEVAVERGEMRGLQVDNVTQYQQEHLTQQLALDNRGQAMPVPGREEIPTNTYFSRTPQSGIARGYANSSPTPGLAVTNGPAGSLYVEIPQSTVTADLDSSIELLGELSEGMVSLDVTLPERGDVYFFTTPQGDVEITARTVSHNSIHRVAWAIGVVLLVLVIGRIVRQACRGRYRWLLGSEANACLLLIGAITLCLLPGLGMLLLAAAIMIWIDRRVKNPKAAKPPITADVVSE